MKLTPRHRPLTGGMKDARECDPVERAVSHAPRPSEENPVRAARVGAHTRLTSLPQPEDTLTTLEILRATRERLTDPANWCGEGPGSGHGDMCVGVAISAASAGADPGEMDAHQAVARAIGRDILTYVTAVHLWNDDPSTTHADVLHALDTAIRNEEAREQEFVVSPLPEQVPA